MTMWGEFKESIPAALRPWLAPAVLLALLGLVWTVGVGHGENQAEINAVNRSLEALHDAVETLRETVGDQSRTVGRLSVTVENLSGSVERVNDAVETLRETVSDQSRTVGRLSVVAETLGNSVESIDSTVDALDETVPLLVSCMIDLNRTQRLVAAYNAIAGGADPETGARQLPDLPESCEQAQNRARR